MLLATNSPFPSTTTDKEITGTTHNSTTMETTKIFTLGSFTSDITSVATQPDTTLSISISSMTQNTGSSGSEASVTATPPTSTTPFCPNPTGFDAASFVGGIILALGVMVILVIIVKCYQHRMSKSELQYSQF